MPTERKIALVAELTEIIERAEIAIATSYQGMSVAEQTGLRAQLSESGVDVRIVKNTLFRRAAADAGREVFAELLDGPTAVVTSTEDAIAAARAVVRYVDGHPTTRFAIRNGVFEGRLIDREYITDLATVPPRDELLSRIAGGLVGKIAELAGLLQATMREFAGLVEARANQLEASGDAPAAEAAGDEASESEASESGASESGTADAEASSPAEPADEATSDEAPAGEGGDELAAEDEPASED